MRSKHLPLALTLALAAAISSGCIFYAGPDVPVTPTGNRAPIISVFDYSPKTGATKSDAITFTVTANDPEMAVLTYTWTSTKGTLSSNTGQSVSWRPTRADGSFEPGLAQVTLIVSDGAQSTTSTANITIDAEGNSHVDPIVIPSPSPEAPATPTPSPVDTHAPESPEVTPTPSAEETLAPVESQEVLFQDGFESGLDQWTLGSYFSGTSNNTLSWKTRLVGAFEGKAAAYAVNGDDKVPMTTRQYPIYLCAKQPIDLTTATLPRVRLAVKNAAVPANTVKFKVLFTENRVAEGYYAQDKDQVGSAFSGGKAWEQKDIDLSSLKGRVGYLSLSVEVENNGNDFDGPAIDDVTVYDAGL